MSPDSVSYHLIALFLLAILSTTIIVGWTYSGVINVDDRLDVKPAVVEDNNKTLKLAGKAIRAAVDSGDAGECDALDGRLLVECVIEVARTSKPDACEMLKDHAGDYGKCITEVSLVKNSGKCDMLGKKTKEYVNCITEKARYEMRPGLCNMLKKGGVKGKDYAFCITELSKDMGEGVCKRLRENSRRYESCLNEVSIEQDGEAGEGLCPDCNVLVILIDALRPDHMGCYGYDKDTSPNIDALSEKSFLFNNAVSQATWTKPSVASIFTSLNPGRHCTLKFSNTIRDGLDTNALPKKLTTIAEAFRNNGYRTYGITNNPFISPKLQFGRGFNTYKLIGWSSPTYTNDRKATSEVLDILSRGGRNERKFIYLHYMGPHTEYNPPPPYNKMFLGGDYVFIDTRMKHQNEYNRINPGMLKVRYMVSQYDGEIAFIDSEVKTLLNGLMEEKMLEKTIVVITADHGEFLGEDINDDGRREFGHVYPPHEIMVKVPLIMHVPGVDGARVISQQVRLIDLMPTLLSMTGGAIPDGLDGTDITPMLKGSEMNLTAYSEENNPEVYSIRRGDWKYTYDFKKNTGSLYNITADPYEREPVANEGKVEDALREEMMDYRDSRLCGEDYDATTGLSKDTIARLRAIGYLT
ncbi:MAG: sulfatase [Candidatus Altiarchaeota archaeon]